MHSPPRAADWESIRLRCSVIGCFLPGFVTVEIEKREVECDEELLHRDDVGFQVLNLATGKQLQLGSNFVPEELRKPNCEFWIALDNDRRWLLFRTLESSAPERRVTESQAI
jgi:hypothetical protein